VQFDGDKLADEHLNLIHHCPDKFID
jgi:hypothetical protein